MAGLATFFRRNSEAPAHSYAKWLRKVRRSVAVERTGIREVAVTGFLRLTACSKRVCRSPGRWEFPFDSVSLRPSASIATRGAHPREPAPDRDRRRSR